MTAASHPADLTALLIGDESLTIACGDILLAGGHRIARVVTRDDQVRSWAEAADLCVVGNPEDLIGDVAPGDVDWLLSIANLRMIPASVLALPAKGAVNFHDGPLPRYAGLNTPAWAIINGETSHGVTWHMIEGGVDEGDILAQSRIDIAADETAFGLNSKCYAAGMEGFHDVLAQLESDSLDRRAQDLTQRSYFARDQRPDNMGVLDFAAAARDIGAMVRGLDFGDFHNPLTKPKIRLDGQYFCVGGASISPDEGKDNAAPGTVLHCRGDVLTVATASTPITLTNLRDITGQPVDVARLCKVGHVLNAPHPDPLPAAVLKHEAHWCAALAKSDPIRLGLARPRESGANIVELPLPRRARLSVADHATALALVALRSANAQNGDIALAASGLEHPLVSGWVPLHISASARSAVADIKQTIAAQMDFAETAPGFPVDLLLRDPAITPRTTPDIAISPRKGAVPGAALSLSVSDDHATLYCDAARIGNEAATILAARLDVALAAIEQGKTRCGDVWALPGAEYDQIVENWNSTERRYNPDLTIHGAFEAQVARAPETEALVYEGNSLSYGELNARANRLAHLLQDMGAGPDTPVALHVTRGIDLMVGALGILKAGGAYVPLDPAYPQDRIAHYIADSGARIIVTQSAVAQDLPPSDAAIVVIDDDARVARGADSNLSVKVAAENLAYLIYTSGSTGTPKGVMVSHGNVANFFAGMDDRIDHATDSVWLAVTSLSFDISVLELFWTLSRGIKLVLAGDSSRTEISSGPIATSDRKIDFNLFYWGNDDGVGPRKYELLLEGAKFADAHGFNAIWTPERHFHAFGGPYPNPSVTGAAVAAVTRNLSIKAGSCVAPLHHPARIAEEWAVIDNMTNGRVGLAIASGWQPDDFVLRPENTPPANKPAMYDAIAQLRDLWHGKPVSFPRQDGTPFDVVTQPRPVSKDLPIWVTTAGNPETWKEAGEIGAHVLTHLLGQSVQEVGDKIAIYHTALRKAGHDPADFTVTVMLHTYLAETREASAKVARGPMKDYLRSAAGLIKQYAWAFPAFKKPEGVNNPFEMDLESLTPDELEAILDFAFERYFNDSGMFGTVEDGLARAEQLKLIGVSEIACLIDYGISTPQVMDGLVPLAEVLKRSNAGAELAEDDFSLAAQILRHRVTHMQCTPSMAQMLVINQEARMALGQLRHLMIGGEALPDALVAAIRGCTGATIQNMYGPTETTIWSTTRILGAGGDDTNGIGTPIANTQVYILDESAAPLPIGAAGELWIGGDGVTQGYWQRDELTAERFVRNPFAKGRMYRTGDLASWTPDGTLHFLGRVDHQVKIRGHRIELGEIEARLAALAGVDQAVVIARSGAGGDQLVGYVTTSTAVDEASMRNALAARLPEVMVPAAIVVLDRMPLTPNRKIDRKSLPAPVRQIRTTGTAPRKITEDATQKAVAEIWTRILGVDHITAEDNFFALGGHSLLAVQAHRDIKAALGVATLSITDIFRFPKLEGLASHLDKLSGQGTKRAPQAAPIADDADRSAMMSKRRMMRAGRNRAAS